MGRPGARDSNLLFAVGGRKLLPLLPRAHLGKELELETELGLKLRYLLLRPDPALERQYWCVTRTAEQTADGQSGGWWDMTRCWTDQLCTRVASRTALQRSGSKGRPCSDSCPQAGLWLAYANTRKMGM